MDVDFEIDIDIVSGSFGTLTFDKFDVGMNANVDCGIARRLDRSCPGGGAVVPQTPLSLLPPALVVRTSMSRAMATSPSDLPREPCLQLDIPPDRNGKTMSCRRRT